MRILDDLAVKVDAFLPFYENERPPLGGSCSAFGYVTNNLLFIFAIGSKDRLLYWDTSPTFVSMSTVSNHHFLLREEQSGIFLQKDALWEACAFSRRSPFKESFNISLSSHKS